MNQNIAEKKPSGKRDINRILLVVALILCLVSAAGSRIVLTNGGTVEVTNISIRTEVGATLTGYLYVPEGASEDNPLPAMVVSHGANSSSESVQSWCLELARRGYVVFSPNLYGAGNSTIPDSEYDDTISVTTYGLYDAVEYVYSLSYVDSDNVGIAGHSLGGGKSMAVAEYYSDLEQEALANGASEEEAHALNKIKVCIPVGYPLEVKIDALPSMSTEDFEGYLCNLCVILGKADDFQSWMNKEVLTNGYGSSWLESQTGIVADEVEEGTIYTSAENGYSFAIWNPNEIHNQNLLSGSVISAMVDFLDNIMPAENSGLTGQIWGFKLFFDFMGIVGLFLFILPFISLIIHSRGFCALLENKAKSFPPLLGERKKKYIKSVVKGAVLNTILLLPCVVIGTNLMTNAVWPQSATNGFAFWGAVAGLFTLHFVTKGTGTKIFKNKEEYGLQITKTDAKSVLMIGLLTITAMYLIVFAAKYFFNSTFQCWTYIIRVFNTARFFEIFRYLPLFFLQQLGNSIATSRNNFENWSDLKRIAFSTSLALIPVVVIMGINYIPILFTGSPMWGWSGSNLFILIMGSGSTRVFNFLFSMATLSVINVKTQKWTGSVWLGAIVNTLIITVTSVAGCMTIVNF